ncbi:hypothetical protein [Herbiconiux liukaitaii]|uniref:hypothetical protein n=1 Tax=Herbiconiux liukaitaii TaxID=3342799 RepID=UPI0035BA77B6
MLVKLASSSTRSTLRRYLGAAVAGPILGFLLGLAIANLIITPGGIADKDPVAWHVVYGLIGFGVAIIVMIGTTSSVVVITRLGGTGWWRVAGGCAGGIVAYVVLIVVAQLITGDLLIVPLFFWTPLPLAVVLLLVLCAAEFLGLSRSERGDKTRVD